MKQQKLLLNHYMKLSDFPTLKVVSQETGIQLTRIFRIFNGYEMKLSEYLIFKKLVFSKVGINNRIDFLAKKCLSSLSPQGVIEVETLLKRKLHLADIKCQILKRKAFQQAI